MTATLVDVDGAFALSKNNMPTYMKFPRGTKKIPGKALLLVNSLNGTKQSAFDWHTKARKLLLELNFKATHRR